MFLGCTARCGGDRFRALMAVPEDQPDLVVDTFGAVLAGAVPHPEVLERVPLFVCERCGAPAANLAEMHEPGEERDRDEYRYRCPECAYELVEARPFEGVMIMCPNCEARYSPDVGLR
ncbi:MAG: hypothetical protein ACYDAY_09905 [Candidatus Dormibacteria bacterium]